MTGHERLMRIFQGKEADRPALKLWGFSHGQALVHPAYRPVADRAAEISDWMESGNSPLNIYCGIGGEERTRQEIHPVANSRWVDRITWLTLPDRTLRSVFRYIPNGEPGYEVEHFVKEPADLKALLACPYQPFPMDLTRFETHQRAVGDKGIVYYNIDHAGYAVSRVMGSELFAFFCVDERELLMKAVSLYRDRLAAHIKEVLSHGAKPVFGWVGPELILPPLASPADFDEFVTRPDGHLCDIIHSGGGYVWVHSHGKVKNFIRRFADMGVDVLNPIEPPPSGDVTLSEAFALAGGRMGLEGNIEIQSLLMDTPENVRAMIQKSAALGKENGRFILCPSSGYMEDCNPSPAYIENLMLYLNYGYECLTAK